MNTQEMLQGVKNYIDTQDAGLIFDISEANAESGVPATYDDIYEALGTGGANVPASVRDGGMSVKFIQQLYTVAKTTSSSAPSGGTSINSDPGIGNGSAYTAADLSAFSSLPTTSSVVYYLSDGESTPTYTIWTISKNAIASCPYVQWRYMGTSISTGFTTIANWQGVDSTPTAGSKNLVESGGVAEELALGTVFDVTAHNNGVTFASLSALLSDANLSTLIPTSVRRGGMSIKFVQTSDNKYVQYRYMGTDATTAATFTNVENWQSDEAVNQKAIQNEFGKVRSDINFKVLNEQPMWESGRISGGKEVASLTHIRNKEYIPLMCFSKIQNPNSVQVLVFAYDLNLNYLGWNLFTVDITKANIENISELTAYFRVVQQNVAEPTNNTLVFELIRPYILSKYVSLVQYTFDSEKYTDIENETDIKSMSAGYFDVNGIFKEEPDLLYQKIEIDHTKAYKIKVTGTHRFSLSTFVMFDDYDNVIYANGSDDTVDIIVTFPKGIKYFGVTARYLSYVVLSVGDFVLKSKHITTEKLMDGAVTQSKIANDAVTTDKIMDKAVNPEKCTFLSTKNIYDCNNTEIKHGYYLYDNVLYENEMYFVSNMIDIESETMYLIQAFNYLNYNYCRWICYYDINGNYLSTYTRQTGDYVFTTPSNAKYMMFTGYEAESQHYVVSTDTTISTYVPYKMTIEKEYLPVEAPVLPDIVVARKSYILNGVQNSIYFKDIMSFYNPNQYAMDRNSGQWLFRERCMRTEGTDTDMNIKLIDVTDLTVLKRVTTVTCKGLQSTDDGAKVVNVIGDSFTYNGKWFDKINDLCPNLSFVGMRKSQNTNAALRAEGRGGWTLHNYATKDFDTRAGKYYEGFSPFLHPSGYTYYGVTGFWADIVNNNIGSHTYEMNGFDDFISMFGTDGKKLNPSTNDMMYDTTQNSYIYYNGSSWVAYSGTPTFEFNYSKYIQAWGITSPDYVLIMLGVNDFFNSYTETIGTRFVNEMQALITSIQAYATSANKTITIGICTNNTVSALPSSNYGTNNILNSRYLFNGRKKVISTFDNATYEAQNVYVVDTAATFDADYGFNVTREKPFSYYDGNDREMLDYNGVHPSAAGYSQLGTCAAGFIQYIRGL